MSRRIGFVDHRLDNYHADVYLKLLRTDLSDLGFTVAGATALETEPSQTWAADNDVPWFDDVATLDEQVDHYVVLAPSNPGSHLDLCRQVFPCGKSTYVDKTFAPDLSTAEAIFALADEHGVALQTTSVLRYTEMQRYVAEAGRQHVSHMVAWGGGSSFGQYASTLWNWWSVVWDRMWRAYNAGARTAQPPVAGMERWRHRRRTCAHRRQHHPLCCLGDDGSRNTLRVHRLAAYLRQHCAGLSDVVRSRRGQRTTSREPRCAPDPLRGGATRSTQHLH
ncbi:MAG: Gfo/Idh/MocA family oxidoreductase [Candidatus Latescibacterota bacterium]